MKVFGGNSKIIEARAILDNASQPNLISEKLCKRLGIKPSTKHIQVSGIGSGRGITTTKFIQIQIASKYGQYSTTIEALVPPSITNYLPKEKLNMHRDTR